MKAYCIQLKEKKHFGHFFVLKKSHSVSVPNTFSLCAMDSLFSVCGDAENEPKPEFFNK